MRTPDLDVSVAGFCAMRILNCKEAGELSISQQNDWQEQYNFPKEDHNEIFF